MKLFEIGEFLFQATKSPTRFREDNKPSILDLAFTKYPNDVSSVQILAPLGKSDHIFILLDLQVQLLEDKQLPSLSWLYYKKKEDRCLLRLPRW